MAGEGAAKQVAPEQEAMEKRAELKEELWPSMKKYFTDTQRPHIISVLDPELAKKVREKVRKRTGGVSPYDVNAAVEEAIRKWTEEP